MTSPRSDALDESFGSHQSEFDYLNYPPYEMARRARRLLKERGKHFSGAMGYTRGAEAGGVIVTSNDETMQVNLTNCHGGFGTFVYSELLDAHGIIRATPELIPHTEQLLIQAQLLDDLASI